MMARALTQRWPIKPEYKDAIIRRLIRVIADPSSSPREITAASKALMAAEKQNQEDEHKVVDVRIANRHAELDAIASDLGIDIRVIEDASRTSTNSTHPIKEDG